MKLLPTRPTPQTKQESQPTYFILDTITHEWCAGGTKFAKAMLASLQGKLTGEWPSVTDADLDMVIGPDLFLDRYKIRRTVSNTFNEVVTRMSQVSIIHPPRQ